MMIQLLQTFDTEKQAVVAMHDYAARLRRRGPAAVKRYGVYVQRTTTRSPLWGVYMKDRFGK